MPKEKKNEVKKEKKNDAKNVVLGNPTTQMTVMAVIVTTIVQPLVQIFHLRDGVTIVLALIVSFLCAFYHVRIVQELKRVESYIVMVLGTFIIFSTALGSNTLIGKDPQAEKAGVTEQKIKNLEDQIKNKNDLLNSLGVEIDNDGADAATRSRLMIPSAPPNRGMFANAATIFENEAFAQDGATAGDNKDKKKGVKPRKRDAVKAYLEKQKKLRQEREALEKQERESKETQQGLWKKW